MTHDEAIKLLNALTGGDNEVAHIEADRIIVRYLRHNGASDIADAFEAADKRVGFWYA